METGSVLRVKEKLLLAVHPFPSVAITVYDPEDEGVMQLFVPLLDQLYVANPACVQSCTASPSHAEAGPVIEILGAEKMVII